tara:strand:- start:267 stop:1127 length:861 start_codon:yes stop_codon:yes gene_type:complete
MEFLMPIGRHRTSINKLRSNQMTFIAAMDNSGGSAGGVLDTYGQEWTEEDKMEKIHAFRMRMINSEAFNSDNIDAAILYKDSVERGAVPVLKEKGIRAILKIDSGTEDSGLLKDFAVEDMVYYGFENGCYGTKMRSIIHNIDTIGPVLEQQFKLAEIIYENNLMPIVEPEIDINNPNKQMLEDALAKSLKDHLGKMTGRCILKLTIPDTPNTYLGLTESHSLIRLVGLSGGYSTEQACLKLSFNRHMQASFSRALSEGLKYNDPDEYFETAISKNINNIKQASMSG